MSMKAREKVGIPEETRRVAQAAFPKGNVYVWMRDELGELYDDELFEGLYPKVGQPAFSPGKLAWVTIMQFMEGLSDRQTAEAVRARIDWKYALGLELADPGFNFSILSEFRQRLVDSQAQQLLLDEFLQAVIQRGWLRERGKQRSDSTHVLAAIRALNRVELVGETMRCALNELALAAPEWLQGIAPPEWYSRYGPRVERIRLPKKPAEREQLALEIGRDGFALMQALLAAADQAELWDLPGVEILRQVWVQQYWIEYLEDEPDDFVLHLRPSESQPAVAQQIRSPYDVAARYGTKRSTKWVGYKVALTETCDEDLPHLLTNVETSVAPSSDIHFTQQIHRALECKQLLPDEHLVDTGFINAKLLFQAQDDLAITLCGPVQRDTHWQAGQEDGLTLADFEIDWTQRTVICPQGKTSQAWSENKTPTYAKLHKIRFQPRDCRPCPARPRCTRSKTGGRVLSILPRAHHEALQKARQAQQTAEFWQKYAQRAGVEGTVSQGVRAFGLRRSRYMGIAKTGLQMLVTALSINIQRLFHWISACPRATTRTSHFARLAPASVSVSGNWGGM